MSTRLNLKYGLVAEHDRLSSSSDSLSVTEPATGSKSRTKGNLYLIVSASTTGGRARDATALVADTIRREYYYDESAGIPICLEKAFRSAEKRLKSGREGHGVEPGSVVALAIIRGTELYVATTGPAEAYLVRAARLLMPEVHSGPGLPTTDGIRLDVWRGEFAVGDSLLLVSRDLTEVVGTEELKNAVVTLHPQSAVEHLHHLFVAAGGEGSDAVLAIEASEVGAPRNAHRLVPVAMPEAPEPDPDLVPATGSRAAIAAVGSRAGGARHAVGNAVGGMTDRLADLIPGRRSQYRRISPRVSRRESQRRAAIALLAFLGIIFLSGVGYALIPQFHEDHVTPVTQGEAAYSDAKAGVDDVDQNDLVSTNPTKAKQELQKAWQDLARAAATPSFPPAEVTSLRARISTDLDAVYGTHFMATTMVAQLTSSTNASPDPVDLVQGPDGAAYVDERGAKNVVRIDPKTGASVVVVKAGDGGSQFITTPMMLGVGGPDLLIYDISNKLWRWRPSDQSGGGTLGALTVTAPWGTDSPDIATFAGTGSTDSSQYNLYVPDPTQQQILRYPPTGDGGGFSPPTDFFLAPNADVANFLGISVDGNIYALTTDTVINNHLGSVLQGWTLAVPPDDGDLRVGHAYALFDGTGAPGSGRLYVWDKTYGRLLVFNKSDGSYVDQWLPAPGSPDMTDLRGMYVVEPTVAPGATATPSPAGSVSPSGSATPSGGAPTVYWVTGNALMSAQLVDAPVAPAPTPTPSVTVSPSPSASSAAPTCRPNGKPPGCVTPAPSSTP